MNFNTLTTNEDKKAFVAWIDEVVFKVKRIKIKEFDILDDVKGNVNPIKFRDFSLTHELKNENDLLLSDGIVEFILLTMAEDEVNELLNPRQYYTVIFKYNGTQKGLDDVTKLTIAQSAFDQFFNYFYYQMTMDFNTSTNHAARLIIKKFSNWAHQYFIDYIK